MYSDSDLESAVVAGVLTAEQIAAFRDYIASTRPSPVLIEELSQLGGLWQEGILTENEFVALKAKILG